jgi:hypothetical protein
VGERENLPECSAFAAIVREQFSQARLCFASENGHTVGKPFVPAFVVSGDALVQESDGGEERESRDEQTDHG